MIELAEGVYQVPVPIPVPLRVVNCYLLRGSAGWTVVDTGFHTPETEQLWRNVFSTLGLAPGRDIEQIVVTHYHPDHFGCAGWFQRVAAGAPVLLLDRELPQVKRFWERGEETALELARFFRRHGMPAAAAQAVSEQHRGQIGRVSPLPDVTVVHEGERIPVGRRRFEVIWAPGHSDGLMILWEAGEGLLLVNDLVLETITPNVTLWAHSPRDVLAIYLTTLTQIRRLPARLSLPGHRRPIRDLAGRIDEILAHHAERLRHTRELVEARGRTTGWQVSEGLFGRQPDPLNARFAMGEALAHLEHLVARGELRREELPDGPVRYEAA